MNGFVVSVVIPTCGRPWMYCGTTGSEKMRAEPRPTNGMAARSVPTAIAAGGRLLSPSERSRTAPKGAISPPISASKRAISVAASSASARVDADRLSVRSAMAGTTAA